MTTHRSLVAALALAAAMLAGACGGSGGGSGAVFGGADPGADGLTLLESHYDSGQLAEQGWIDAEGRRSGVWRAWHPSGQLEREATYADGEPEGPVREWHANGQLRWQGTFPGGGRPSVDWVEYNADGSVRFDASDR